MINVAIVTPFSIVNNKFIIKSWTKLYNWTMQFGKKNTCFRQSFLLRILKSIRQRLSILKFAASNPPQVPWELKVRNLLLCDLEIKFKLDLFSNK